MPSEPDNEIILDDKDLRFIISRGQAGVVFATLICRPGMMPLAMKPLFTSKQQAREFQEKCVAYHCHGNN